MIAPIEIVWTTVNVIGFLVSLFAVGDALGDLRLVRRQRVNGARRLIARSNFRREVIRSVELLVFAMAGFIATFVPSPTPEPARTAIISCLIVVATLISTSTVLDRFTRYRVLNYNDAPPESLQGR